MRHLRLRLLAIPLVIARPRPAPLLEAPSDEAGERIPCNDVRSVGSLKSELSIDVKYSMAVQSQVDWSAGAARERLQS